MSAFLRFIEQMAANPYLTMMVYFLSFLSVLLAIILYYKSRKIKIPLYAIKTNNIVADYISKISSLNVLYSGNQIDNLSVSKIAFWNNGNEPIKSNDIAQKDPLRIVSKNNSKILDANIINYIKPANNINLKISDNGSEAIITFDFLAKNEGVIIQVYHTGKTNNDIQIEGTIIGGKKILRKNLLINEKKERRVGLIAIPSILIASIIISLITYNIIMDKGTPISAKIFFVIACYKNKIQRVTILNRFFRQLF